MTNQSQTSNEKTKRPVKKIIGWVVLAIAGVIFAIGIYNLVSNLVATWNITSLPGAAITAPTSTPDASGEAVTEDTVVEAVPAPVASTGPQPEPWDGASRVNILLIGLDYNSWRGDNGPPLSDSMILFTIDPLSKTAGMLSIPRDMWVNIPGFEHGKINTAYQAGEAYKLPGGGPGLAMETVEALLGVPIQYYAQIDFAAFVYFIQQMGGLKLDVPYEMYVDIYDDPKGKIKLQPGVQTMPGEYVLAYARARHTEGGDFDRAARQQQVVMAIRQRILDLSLLPVLVQKAPEMYQQLSSGINTNLTLDQVIQLAWLAQEIPTENIYNRVIGPDQVQFGKSPTGLDILKPIPDQIRVLRNEVFAQEKMSGPLDYGGKSTLDLIIAEGATVKVLNGTTVAGLATRTADYLQSLGVNVVATGDASAVDYSSSHVYDYKGKPHALVYFSELLGLSTYTIHGRYDQESDTDITVILGFDWANNNPMP
ncbi:MAG: LCP family protein [Chloroflexi bacterium]|jgi:polyisoprenyl-teichoic acid--peptidoglycan teichoic acid transferase|nr:LCP family protein [Chloroflexota bacterium]